MPLIYNSVRDGSSVLYEEISEQRKLANRFHLLPMAVMRSCLNLLSPSRQPAAGLVPSSGRGSQKALEWKTSSTGIFSESANQGKQSKRNIPREELKKSISVPYGPLHLVEVGPLEGEDAVEGGEHERHRILRPPAYRASAIRPRRIVLGKNSYAPMQSTLTQPVSSEHYRGYEGEIKIHER